MQDDGFIMQMNETCEADELISFPVAFLTELNNATSTQSIIALLALWLPKFIKADRSSVALRTDEDHLAVFAFDGAAAVPEEFPLPIDGTAIGLSYRTKQFRLTPDINTLYAPEADYKLLMGKGLVCVMCAPLLVGGECFGTLNAAHKTPDFYGPRDVKIFQSLAFWIAANIRVQQQFQQLAKREQEARKLAFVCENIGDMIVIADKNHKIEWVNKSFEEITGYTLVEVEGKIARDIFFGPNSDPDIIKYVTDNLAAKKGVRYELPLRNKSGEEIWIEANVEPMLDEHGNVDMYIGSHREITQAKLAEHKLRESEAEAKQLAIFAEQTHDIIMITNVAREIEWVNKAFEKTYGYSLKEVIGLTPLSFLKGPATCAKTLDRMEQTLQQGQAVREELKLYNKSGQEIWVQVNLNFFLNDRGEPEKLIGIQHDISKLKQREAELKTTQEEAERSNLLKSEFLANMSHEIRTPLNGVLGMTQLLERTELDEHQKKFTEIITSSGTSLLSIINDVLDISKVEAGLLELEDESFNVEALVEQVKDTVLGIAVKKGLSIDSSVASDAAGEFMGDAKRIRQVLINLAGNAVKFTKQGGVHISVTKSEQGGLHFVVNDSGPGISPNQQKTIFERFRQADGSSTRTHGGTGLGLAISADLVSLMGGEIGVESIAGEGAKFWFFLPLVESVKALDGAVENLREIAGNAQEAASQENIKILLTEDNVVNQKVVIAALNMEGGFEVVVAENGIEAIECLEKQAFDLVLMDIQMPVMNGDEAIRKIRASGRTYADVPIIALTANAMNDVREQYLDLGANDYLAKPVDIAQLIECIKNLSEKKINQISVA